MTIEKPCNILRVKRIHYKYFYLTIKNKIPNILGLQSLKCEDFNSVLYPVIKNPFGFVQLIIQNKQFEYIKVICQYFQVLTNLIGVVDMMIWCFSLAL